jgi:hypothetical protein
MVRYECDIARFAPSCSRFHHVHTSVCRLRAVHIPGDRTHMRCAWCSQHAPRHAPTRLADTRHPQKIFGRAQLYPRPGTLIGASASYEINSARNLSAPERNSPDKVLKRYNRDRASKIGDHNITIYGKCLELRSPTISSDLGARCSNF